MKVRGNTAGLKMGPFLYSGNAKEAESQAQGLIVREQVHKPEAQPGRSSPWAHEVERDRRWYLEDFTHQTEP